MRSVTKSTFKKTCANVRADRALRLHSADCTRRSAIWCCVHAAPQVRLHRHAHALPTTPAIHCVYPSGKPVTGMNRGRARVSGPPAIMRFQQGHTLVRSASHPLHSSHLLHIAVAIAHLTHQYTDQQANNFARPARLAWPQWLQPMLILQDCTTCHSDSRPALSTRSQSADRVL
jgi:hypothetical protein